MTTISRDDVLRLAKLSKLSLTDEEADAFAQEFQTILGYVEQLQSVDINGIEPTYLLNHRETRLADMREDEVDPGLPSPAELLKNVPHTQEGYIKVRRVL